MSSDRQSPVTLPVDRRDDDRPGDRPALELEATAPSLSQATEPLEADPIRYRFGLAVALTLTCAANFETPDTYVVRCPSCSTVDVLLRVPDRGDRTCDHCDRLRGVTPFCRGDLDA